jgi:hypothetical protein
MHRSRDRAPADSPTRPGAPARGGPARLNRAGVALALQRAAGNSATARLLAREEAAAGFRLLLVDDGNTGLDAKIVEAAIAIVAAELARITKDSGEQAVRAGFEIQHRTAKPAQPEVRDLGQRTWLIFLTRGRDAEHALELATEYVPMSEEERKGQETRFKQHMAAEGGVNIERVGSRRRSESVGFVGTEIALKKLKEPNAGGRQTAAAIVADVILHEIGHALGHNDALGAKDHDDAGVMTASLVLGAGPFQTRRYSTRSASVIRARLEELARKPARKRG